MRAIVQAVIHELRLTAAKKSRPEIIVHDLLPVCGDPILIRQVFANLLSNAIKFTSGREQPIIEIGGSTTNW